MLPAALAVGAGAAGFGGVPAAAGAPAARPVELHPVLANAAEARGRGRGYEGAVLRAERAARAIPVAPAPAGAASNAWTPLGPAPESGGYGGANSGRVTGLAVTPGSSPSIYLASAGGGVWSSADGGSTWATHTDAQPDIATGSVAVDPSDPSAVFAGTGEDNECGDCFFGAGILESTDGGSTWTTSDPGGVFAGQDISSVVVEPGAASLSATKVLAGGTAGLYVSSNGGTSWSAEAGTGWHDGNVTSIVINSLTSLVTIYAAVQDVGVEESTNNGSSWSTVQSFSSGNGALAIAPAITAASTTLYDSVGSTGGYVGLYKSTNGGGSWSTVSVPWFTSADYAYYGTNDDVGDQSWYDNVIAVDPTNPSVVVAGGITAVESTNGGASWTNLDGGGFFTVVTPLFHPDFHALAFDSSGNLYIGNDGGAWEMAATDVTGQTLSFTNLNTNLDITQFYGGMAQAGNGATILGGSQDNGSDLYQASNSPATTWSQVTGGDGGFSAIDPANTDIAYTEADISGGGSLEKTTNGWASLSPVTTPPFRSANWAAPLTIVPGTTGPTVLFGGDNLYQSTNGGSSWSTLGAATSHQGSDVSAIAVAPGNPAVLYAGFDDGVVQLSTDSGATWRTLSPPTGGLTVTHIAVSATNPDTAYLTVATAYDGIVSAPSGPGVLAGTNLDATASWSDVSGNLPAGIPTNSVVPDGTGGLVVADDVGVYWASSLGGSGTSWARVGTGLPRVQTMDLALTSTGALIADTHGRGAWSFQFRTGTSSTALALSSGTATYGHEQTEKLSVTVSTSLTGAVPTGSVKVRTPATTLCSITLSSARGSCYLSARKLVPGTYALSASYSGDAELTGSTSPGVSLKVTKEDSKTVLKLSASSIVYGHEQLERLSVTVTPQYAGIVATGKVRIATPLSLLCVVTLASGKGSCTLSPKALARGTHRLFAAYGGNTELKGSTSAYDSLSVT